MDKKIERWDRIEDNPLIIVSRLMEMEDWIKDAQEFVDDEDFGAVLRLAAQIITNGIELDNAKVKVIIVKLSAYSLKFRAMFTSYMSYKKGTDEANMKKNAYRYIYEGVDNLVDAMKYMVRN